MGLEVAEKTELVLGLLLGTGGHLVRQKAKGRRETTFNSSKTQGEPVALV